MQKNISEIKLTNFLEEFAQTRYKDRVVNHIENGINNLEGIKRRIMHLMKTEVDLDRISTLRSKLIEVSNSKNELMGYVKDGTFTLAEVGVMGKQYNVQIEELEAELIAASKGTDTFLEEIREIDSTIERLELIELKDSYTLDDIKGEIDYVLIGGLGLAETKGVMINPRFKIYQLIDSLHKKHRIEIK